MAAAVQKAVAIPPTSVVFRRQRMQFLVTNGHVECPACGLQLVKVREQDRRVHIMHHPATEFCSCNNKMLRIDRISGYGEVHGNA